jgi:hypothetical protein
MISSGTSIAVAGLIMALAIGPASAAQLADKRGQVEFNLLANRVWMEMTPGSTKPGAMMTFLSNGTLIRASCTTPYILSSWRTASPRKITWDDGTGPVSADVISISSVELVLEISNDKSEHVYLSSEGRTACPQTPS